MDVFHGPKIGVFAFHYVADMYKVNIGHSKLKVSSVSEAILLTNQQSRRSHPKKYMRHVSSIYILHEEEEFSDRSYNHIKKSRKIARCILKIR